MVVIFLSFVVFFRILPTVSLAKIGAWRRKIQLVLSEVQFLFSFCPTNQAVSHFYSVSRCFSLGRNSCCLGLSALVIRSLLYFPLDFSCLLHPVSCSSLVLFIVEAVSRWGYFFITDLTTWAVAYRRNVCHRYLQSCLNLLLIKS